MKRAKILIAGPIALALALAIHVGGTPQASAADESPVTIHHRLCPTDQTVDDVFEDCHDGLVGQSFAFTVDSSAGEQTFETDAATSNGSITVPAGEVEIWGGVPGEFATTFVYCSQDQVALDVTPTSMGVSFEAPAGEVICDWYNTPEDLSGGGSDDGNDDEDGGTVTALPNTGVGPAGGASVNALIAVITGLGTIGLALALPRRRA
jgi:hypothetical protein